MLFRSISMSMLKRVYLPKWLFNVSDAWSFSTQIHHQHVKKLNYNATKRIKQLINDNNGKDKDRLIRNVFAVYDALDNNQDCILINKLLTFCLNQINHPAVKIKITNISDRILQFEQMDIATIGLMMKCLINTNNSDRAMHLYQQYNGKHNDITHKLYLNAASTSNQNKMDLFFKNINQHSISLFEYYCCKQNGYSNADLFKICKKKKIDPLKYILSALLGRCIATKNFDKFDILFHSIMRNIPKYVDDVIFCCILDGLIKNGKSEIFESVWNKITQNDIIPNIDCYRLALLALSYSKNEHSLNQFVEEIKEKFIQNDTISASEKIMFLNHILTAYANLSNHERIWTEYEQMKLFKIKPDIVTLSVLTSIGDTKYIQMGLNEVKQYLLHSNEYKRVDIGTLTGFYRKAIYVQDKSLIKTLKPIISKWLSPKSVFAEIKYKDDVIYFDNGYKEENKQILQKIADLMKDIGHCVDVNYHSEIGEDRAYNLLSYHAEKRALAFMLEMDQNENEIEIKVNLRMCNDCHSFFCGVSRLYPNKKITVIDPKIRHFFQDGHCSCSKSRYKTS